MQRLSGHDIAALLDYLPELYRARTPEHLVSQLVSAIPALVPAEAIAYNHINVHRHAIAGVSNPPVGAMVPDGAHVFDQHLSEHPLILSQQEHPNVGTFRISDVVSLTAWHRLGLYREFFHPARLEHQIGLVLKSRPPAIRSLALSRGRPDFSDHERIMLDALRPHVTLAFSNAEALAHTERHLALLSRAAETRAIDTVAISSDGWLIHAPPRACGRLWHFFGPRLQGHNRASSLPEPVRAWIDHCLETLRPHDDVPAPLMPLVEHRNTRRLVVRFFPPDPDDMAWLTIEEQALRRQTPLAEHLDVTPRQAEIAEMVLDGLTNQEIARALGISPLTVRTHLEHIFERLGIHSRTELARQAAMNLAWEPVVGAPDTA